MWIYRNLTPWRIFACFDDKGQLFVEAHPNQRDCGPCATKVLSIPALGEVTVPHDDAKHLDTLGCRRRGQIKVRPAPSEFWSALPRAIVSFGWLAVGLVFGAWALFFGGGSAVPWAWFVAALVAVPVVALAVATGREVLLYRRFRHYRARTRTSLEGIEQGSRFCNFVDGLPRQALETAVLIGAVLISVVGLGVAILHTTQLDDLLPIDYGDLLRLHDPFGAVNELAATSPAFAQLLIGHIAQWVLVSIAALAPAAMYFQFDRQRLAAVQRRWVQEVFRLDPTVRTVGDIEAKYGSQIEASFGVVAPDSGLRVRGGRRSPVIVATILLVVGWFLVISTTPVPDLVPGDGKLVWPGDGSFPVAAFFRPELSLVGYAFLGSYVFTLFHVLRGYQRRDLQPKTYNTVVVRILAAYALALVVSVVYVGPAAEVVMFFVGFVPESALVWLREKLSQGSGGWKIVPLHEPAPLTELEGIDLYDRTRLAEEGVNNVEALAHADIVDLMSSTRISAAELVDWTDQAILYLRVGGDAAAQCDKQRRGKNGPAAKPPMVRDNLCHLRAYGIRTATDLLQAYDQAVRRGGGSREREQAEVELLRMALELPSKPDDAPISTIQTMIDTLGDEEWFTQVRNWHNSEFGKPDSWYWYLSGEGWTPRRAWVPGLVEQAKAPFRACPMAQPVAPTAAVPTPLPVPGGLKSAS